MSSEVLSSRQKHQFSPTSTPLQFNFHSVIIRLVACAEDRRLDAQSFCRRFHGDRKRIRISCLFVMAEGLDEVTVINMSRVKKKKKKKMNLNVTEVAKVRTPAEVQIQIKTGKSGSTDSISLLK